MAPKKKPSSLPIPIGNCEVVVEAKSFKSESDHNTLHISISKNINVKISVVENRSEKISDDPQNHVTGNLHFVLINSKDPDSQAQSQLQDVLSLYVKELPAMNFAANTGKQSTFLKRCVSNGKYCTLLLKSNSIEDSGEVVAALTYQIIPADTRYAEVPLAAVRSTYQRKGIGTHMYRELSNRLQNVGISTIFCWGDTESEGFWSKQGFVSIGEVDNKGKARKLRIKADIRKALCFPGGATLLVSHLNMDNSVNCEDPLKLLCSRPLQNSLPNDTVRNHRLHDERETELPLAVGNLTQPRTTHSLSQELEENDSRMDGTHNHANSGIQVIVDLDNKACGKTSNARAFTGVGTDVDTKQCSFSSLGEKKRVWESSCTSLKSKKVKGGYQVDKNLDCSGFVRNSLEDKRSSEFSGSGSFVDARGSFTSSCFEKTAAVCQHVNRVPHDYASNELISRRRSFTIMLMNIADDAKRSNLSKIIEDLGGDVTNDGSLSTHVVTGKARKTLNFCTALCSGAWIISPSWLKESYRNGKFVDETDFILKDEDYELKYKIELKDAVQRARDRPQALFKGYKICLAALLQPPRHNLSIIVRFAGGDVILGLEKVEEISDTSHTIFLASEEDMEEAMCAIRRDIQTFSCDWFMNCIMRQELDFDAPQFAENL